MIGVEATQRLLARPVLLVAPGGEPSDAASLWSDAPADLSAAIASGVAAPGERRKITAKVESDGEVSEKSLEAG